MCGIIGYIGARKALPIILEGLTRMEYRGYDSAGLSVLSGRDVKTVKVKGKVALLRETCQSAPPEGMLGIGHTRWATHGEPSVKNAHPHKDCTGDFLVVHNGIIENHASLKKRLQKKGHRFASATDTEVIAHLIEEKYKGNLREAVRAALKDLVGAFSIVVLSRRAPEELIAARFGSPLILGLAKTGMVVASDSVAILPVTKEVIYLNDGELVRMTGEEYSIENFRNGVSSKRRATTIPWDSEAAEKKGFPHFMLKEIFEQPQGLRDSMRGRLLPKEGAVKFGGLEKFDARLRELKRLTIVGMGTARLTGIIGEYALEELTGLPVKVEFGSEFAYRSAAGDEKGALIAVSQSGETSDTLNAVREAKRRGMLTLGIVNTIGSSIAREVDAGIYNHIGPEIAVASTKASTSETLLLIMLALYMGRMRGMSRAAGRELIDAMERLPAQVEKVLKAAPKIKKIARKYKTATHFFFLGRKYNTASAYEGALKLKEVAYVHAEGYNGAEMKHGPIALIDKAFPSFVIAPTDSVYEKNVNHIEEIKARGGKVIALATEGNRDIARLADEVFYIPKTEEMLTPILAFVPLQLFAYYSALARGTDVDKPRNLAKSVTVE